MSDDLFEGSLRDDLGDVSRELERIGDLADGVARRVSTAFRAALVDGKDFRSVLADIAAGFADIALKAAFKPIGDLVGGLVETVFAATNPALGGASPFVASGPSVMSGAIATPTYFPGPGEGVKGVSQVAPTASLPRMATLSGPTTTGPVNVTFNVTASDARSFAASEAEVSAMLLRAVRRGTRGS